MRVALSSVLLLLAGASASAAQGGPPAEVVVLSTLHQFHGEIPGYSFETLSRVVERLEPDVLAVELTGEELRTRRDQGIKQEYPRSVFPLLDARGYEAVALEPPEPLYSELVGLLRGATAALQAEHPEKAEAFGTYSDELYGMLFERWTSPEAVNSAETDALLEAKHRFQSALFGHAEATAWQGWNEHFLSRILETAAARPGQRIVALVGVEHAYWLRARLRESEGVRLLDPAALLAPAGAR